jgi:hypothetical protein
MKLYCKKTYYLDHYYTNSEKVIIKGGVYNAEKYNSVIKVDSNDGRTITFSEEPKSQQYKYYKKYFYTESEMRKKKLNKLNSIMNKLLNLFR